MLPPTTKGIERSSSMLSSPHEIDPDFQPAASSSLSSFSDVGMAEGSSSSSSHGVHAEAHTAAAGKAKIEYSPDYYIESTFVVFQVENTLFRVPTYMLSGGSQFFNGMFRLPQPANGGDSIEGLSDSNPIVIPGNIKRGEFGDFMKVLYPRSVSAKLKLSKIEWISVLKVSRIWYFLDIRSVAISQLEKGGELTYIDKVVLGRQNWIRSWVVDSLVGLVQRKETVSDEEAIQIDYITAVKVLRIREARIERQLARAAALIILEEVQAVFSDEIAHVASEERGFCAPEDEDQLELPEDHVRIDDPQPFAEEATPQSPLAETIQAVYPAAVVDFSPDTIPASDSLFGSLSGQFGNSPFGGNAFGSDNVSEGFASSPIRKNKKGKKAATSTSLWG